MLPTNIRRTFDSPLAVLREFDRAVNRAWDEATTVGSETFPVDVYEQDDTLVVEAELPGYTKDQIDVNVEQGVLTIEAKRHERVDGAEQDKAGKTRKRHLAERVPQVTRRFTLPSAYDTSNVDASLENGVLTLRLPKREEVKPRKIEVK